MNKAFSPHRNKRQSSGNAARGRLVMLLVAAWGFATAGCIPLMDIVPAGNTSAVVDLGALDPQNAVCNPFSSGTHPASAYDHGLVARMRYLSDEQPRYTRSTDYLTNGHLIDAPIFFGNLDIPTRPFDRGFVTIGGETILNSNGNTLYEYFALEFETVAQLPAAAAEGDYQLALLSDDGATVEIDRGNGWEMIVDNDGTHATRMGCGTSFPIHLSASQGVPMRVRYYQGPRYHIALMLLYRPWSTTTAGRPLNDTECGRSGNARYFDSTQNPPAPQAAYNGLLARGWSIMPAEVFRLPQSVASNPCGTLAPVDTAISAASITESVTQATFATFQFYSNKTDAIFYCNMDGGAYSQCASPITINGITDGVHTFTVYAVDGNGIPDSTPASYNWLVDTVAPFVESITVTVTTTTATVDWSTNELTTGDLYWGPGTTIPNFMAGDGSFSMSHSMTMTGLTGNAVYSYKPSGADQAGNPLSASRRVLRTAP